ncbi:MAG: hypothetical protein ACXWCY_16810 [Burkholderiales bacterium]
MNGNRIALSFIAIIVFTGLGCRQESPGAPPAAPTPKTSSAPSDPIAAAPATAAQNEKTNSDPGITTGSNVEDAVVTGKVRRHYLVTRT